MTETSAEPTVATRAPVPAPVVGTSSRRRRSHDRRWLAVRVVVAVLVCAVMVFPLYWMVVVAFSSRAELLGGDLRLWPRSFTIVNV